MEYLYPLIQKCFNKKYKAPTDIQLKSWPIISEGGHVLVTAPTGSGKTLTAFLWALNELITGSWPSNQTVILYISPLKALNNDIKENLITPLNELKDVFKKAGKEIPAIGVQTRSGDIDRFKCIAII